MAPLTRLLGRMTVCGLIVLAGVGNTVAETYPSRPIRLIVPFPPGGALDAIARRVQPVVQRELGGISVIIDNKAGASASIGTAAAAVAPPDGYTVLMMFDTHAVNPSLMSLPYDSIKDFAPVMKIGEAPMILVANPAAPQKTFADVVAAAKAKPGTVPYGTVGQGSLAHLVMSQMRRELDVDWTHVPYKGGAPMVNDVTAGHLPFAIASIALLGSHVKAGKLTGLAVTSPKRHPQFPNIPTVGELGVPGFAANAWWGLMVPAKTPPEIIARLNAAFTAAFNDPGVKETLVDQAGIIYDMATPEAFAAFVATEIDRWSKVVRDNKISPE